MRHCYIVISLLIFLSACSSQSEKSQAEIDAERSAEYQRTRYDVANDFSPLLLLKPETVRDAIPKNEPIKKAGNKNPYTVLGQTYHLLSQEQAKTYKEQGGASWYGLKFHGHKTSNGETYSIYGMTAAHKTLPIPSYVKVTNVANGKTTVVRVNDRGPFHPGRIIDLSYAAATKLDYINQGTAEVIVEAIDVDRYLAEAKKAPKLPSEAQLNAPKEWILQVAALSNKTRANEIKAQLQQALGKPVFLEQANATIIRIKVGPLTAAEADLAHEKIIAEGFAPAIRIRMEKK
jgi:rare lipoprotein A